MAKYSKAIGSLLGGLVAVLVAFNVLPEDAITPEIIGSVSMIAATIAVYFAPANKEV